MTKASSDMVCIDDRARGEVYVCLNGQLGAHLNQEIKDLEG